MSRPRGSGAGNDKKGSSRQAVPRPGTMAHLRYVEEQKHREKREQRPARIAKSEVADSSPIKDSITDPNRRNLSQRAGDEEIGIKAHVVIHGAAVAAATVGGGLSQIPASGTFVITPIQISMIIALGSLHGKTLDKSSALAVLAGAYGPYVGRSVSQLLIGWIPGAGNAINAATAFVITESIGWTAHRILSSD